MVIEQFLTSILELNAADVVSVAKIRFAPMSGESFSAPSIKRGYHGYYK